MSERVFGAFIVKQSKRREPHTAKYDHDEFSHILLVQHAISQNGLISEMRVNGNTPNTVNEIHLIYHVIPNNLIGRWEVPIWLSCEKIEVGSKRHV